MTLNQPFSFVPSISSLLPLMAAMAITVGPNVCAAGDASSASTQSTRYGLFNMLDHRSSYGEGAYPEPFLVDDSNLEFNEARFDWLHSEGRATQIDEGKVEIEKGFGLLTIELELPIERDAASGEKTVAGLSNFNIGARYPIYQYVAPAAGFDTTFGVAGEVGIPINSGISRNWEFVPKIFNDLKFGQFTLQSVLGYSTLSGGGEDSQRQALEYGFVLGYAIPHDKLPIPGVVQLTPVFEMAGEKALNKAEAGQNNILGNVAIRANLSAIGPILPKIGVGFVFPLTEVAHQEMHWGIFTSLVFEY